MDKQLINKVEVLQELLIDHSTGGVGDADEFFKLRRELLSEPLLNEKLPAFLKASRNLKQFWSFIKIQEGSYEGRRKFLWGAFNPVFEFLENPKNTPAEIVISERVAAITEGYIKSEWTKALQRKIEDPEGAITSSRTLIETVCKHILDDLKVEYDDKLELPQLYKLTAKQLNLAPDQHTEKIFKQILNGCQAVVEGLGGVRNRLSDSHGKKMTSAKPSSRHAELAVNLAGTMTAFLYETFENMREVVAPK